ncbi:MAG TPA: MucR family transcriptional regulator [Sphingomonadales bacterium]|nr:MucR family transcriptional regulator [Sphingomonadales bacterium]
MRTLPHADDRLLALATDVVVSYVKRNPVPSKALTKVIEEVHRTFLDLADNSHASLRQLPAITPERSVTHDYIVCLEDGEKLKMLKRHLRSKFGMTPDQYRKKWNLPPSYPMVAPGYADTRSRLARSMGLGKNPTYLAREKNSKVLPLKRRP